VKRPTRKPNTRSDRNRSSEYKSPRKGTKSRYKKSEERRPEHKPKRWEKKGKPPEKKPQKRYNSPLPKQEKATFEVRQRLLSAEGIRINKFIAEAGVCSRRKADELIAQGMVKVNGQVVTELGLKINPSRDKVFVNDRQAVNLDRLVYIIFNKPKDCITTASDERGRMTVMDYVKVRERIFPIGRLDRNTTGVLLLTNDGELANRLMHPRHEIKKAYKATLDKAFSTEDAHKMEQGIRLYDGKTAPAEVYTVTGGKNKIIGVIIHEGKNRQVHRMFEALGFEVEKLDRVAYADLSYEGLARGGWRYLSKGELRNLKKLAGLDQEEK